jgi:heat shock protein HslJ
MRLTALVAVALAAVFALSGCITLDPPEDMPGAQTISYGGDLAATLIGGEWIVQDVDGGGVIDNARGTLIFGSDGRVAGRAFCNQYGARYTISGTVLAIDQAAATKMACAPALMSLEAKFLSALAAVRGYALAPDGALTLAGGGRTITARRG